ncbi:MAG: TlpA disulfide reductase family protein [Polaribacter sp.]
MLFITSIIAQKQTAVNNNNNNNNNKDYILFSGNILNAPSKKFTLRDGDGKSITIQLDENGSFSDTLTSGSNHYILYDPSRRLDFYFVNGEEYNLKTDLNKFKSSAKLTGTDLDASNYIMTRSAKFKEIRESNADLYSLNEKDFKAKLTEFNNSYIAYLESFPGIPNDFEEDERQEFEYFRLLSLAKYQKLHQYYTKQPDFKVSENFLNDLKDIDYQDEEIYRSNGYYDDLVSVHFNTKAEKLAEKEGVNIYYAKLKEFGTISNDYIKNRLLASVGTRDIANVENKKEYYDAFVMVSTSPKNNEKVKAKYENLQLLEKGKPSPVFTNYTNHAGGKTSLSDFKGKYVYIDVWATWCAPCIAQVPSLKKVEKQYHGKDIAFVSISVDNDRKYKAWKKMVVDEDLSGVQLFADKSFNSDFIVDYKINIIPRFILLGPDGTIVDSNAPRPSDPKLITLFNELNI